MGQAIPEGVKGNSSSFTDILCDFYRGCVRRNKLHIFARDNFTKKIAYCFSAHSKLLTEMAKDNRHSLLNNN